MKPLDDPFLSAATRADEATPSEALLGRTPAAPRPSLNPAGPGAAPGTPELATLYGFDLQEQPLLTGLSAHPGEVVSALSTVKLKRSHIGRQALVMCAGGDQRRPIILGMVDPQALEDAPVAFDSSGAGATHLTVDGERQIIEAEREIVLRCGEASITLTRAGKVIIKGTYILSRSSGYNKIKGAAIDLN